MSEVILLSHGFQPEYEAGYANGIARRGITVTLIGSDTTLTDRLEPGVHFINLRRSQRPDRSRTEKVHNLIRYFLAYCFFLFRKRGIAVHVIGQFSTQSLWLSLVEAWTTRLVSGGYILTVHNLLPHDRHTWINIRLNYWIYRSASYLMVHTHRMRRELYQNFSIDPDLIIVVEHGIDRLLPDTAFMRERMRAKLGIDAQEQVLLFFGNIAHYKGVDILLRAFQLPNAGSADRLIVAGRCRDRSLALELQAMVEANARRDAILWREGFVDESDVAPLFHAADVLVMPYRHIDQSGVLFMALATGLRVVVTDVGSLRDYVTGGKGSIAPVDDPEALASSIKEVLTSATGNPVDYGAEHYLWQRTVLPILPLYMRA
jgi:glycosyltransferase involved in cell wall biosynthesis